LPVWRGPLRDVDLGRSVSFFPLVGLVLGFALTGVAAALAGSLAPSLVAALAQLAERRDLLSLLAFPAVARWLGALLVVLFPYVRAEGLGRAFSGEAGRTQLAVATAIVVVVVAVLGTPLILPALGTTAAVFAFAFWMHRRLGGLTGDVYGAAIELGEVVMLVLCCVR